MHGQQQPTFPARGRVLIADDQSQVLFALEMLLRRHGFSTSVASHPASILQKLQNEMFAAVLMDMNYARDTIGGREGLQLVSQIRSQHSLLPIIVMTAWSSVDLAVDAMRRGASDFVQKPWDNDELVQKVHDQVSVAEARQRKQRLCELEMREARAIHDRALPERLPVIPGYEVAAVTQPLQLVGGDYYTVAQITERYTALGIADVSGKGLPAALLMSSLQAATRPLLEQNLAPRELCSRLNRILCDLTPLDKFVSFFYAVLDSEEDSLTYCNAGHNPPWLMHPDGKGIELESTGAVLGQFPHWSFEQEQVRINEGDILLLFTDGLVEACNTTDEPFGERRLIRVAHHNATRKAEDLKRLLFHSVAEHCLGNFQDDATLIVLKRT